LKNEVEDVIVLRLPAAVRRPPKFQGWRRGRRGLVGSIQLYYYPTPKLIFSSNPHGYEQASHFPFPDTKTYLSNPVYINTYVN